jgi:hypothetical protein
MAGGICHLATADAGVRATRRPGVDGEDADRIGLWDPLVPGRPARRPSIAVTPDERSQGRISQARTLLNQQHWAGTVWALDRVVIEQVMQFDTAAHAAVYMATWRQQNAGSAIATSTFEKVTVATARTRSGDLAAFTVGDYAVLLNVSTTPTSQPENLNAIITAAVTAASPAG